MSDDELLGFLKRCSDELVEKQEKLAHDYGIGSFDSWNYDQTTRRLYFLNSGKRVLECDVIVIATWVEGKTDWMWGWANGSLDAEIRSRSEKLKNLAVVTRESVFAETHLEADRSGAEELAAMSVHTLGAMGLYVGPAGKSQIFFAIVTVSKL